MFMSNAKEPYKKVYCPLCKVEMVHEELNEEEGTYLFLSCPICKLSTYPILSYYSSETDWNEVVEDAEKLISKFPPIMRLNVGDKVSGTTMTGKSRVGATVEEVHGTKGFVLTDKGMFTQHGIEKWPWDNYCE